jgi:molybdopterin molybdotransferase
MRSLVEAQREVLDAVEPLPVTTVDVMDTGGAALAADVFAPHDVPPFPNSGMDGFAVLAADVAEPPVDLEVIEDLPAGTVATKTVVPGTAIKIMTGAPMPAGADTVVPVEDTEMDGGTVRLRAGRPMGANVRAAGGDLRAGDLVMEAGTRLDAIRISVLASLGIRPTVRRRPLVAIFSTGDELRPPDTAELEPGAIRDSNRPLLHQLILETGCSIHDLGIVPDDEGTLRLKLERAAADADLIVSSGGVSMGEYDLVKQVLGSLGSVDFWKVAMKPGKPFAFGRVTGRPFFGLPGNPVSVFVSFEQFVRPAILTMMGSRHVFRVRRMGRAAQPLDGDEQRLTFARVAFDRDEERDFVVRPAGGQGSNMLTALSRADALAVIPPGVEVAAGDEVQLEMFRWPEGRSKEEALA